MLRRWEPIFRAVNPKTGDLSTYVAPVIEAPSAKLAQEWCNINNMAHCVVDETCEVLVEGVIDRDGNMFYIDHDKIMQQ